MDFLFEAVQPIFDCDRVGVSFLEEGGARTVAHYTRAGYEPVLLKKGYAEELAGSSLAGVIESGRPRLLRDLERHLVEHPSSRSTKLLVSEGVRSSMTCPLLVEGRVAGLLFFSSRRPDAYTEHHVLLHLAIAERLGQAVEKARRIEELAEANRAYFEMLGFVSHELKSPLASIVMDARLLTDGYVGNLDEAQRQVVARMVRKADYLLNLVRDYLDLSQIEGGQLAITLRSGVDLMADVVEPACDMVKVLAEEKRMRIERTYPSSPAVLAGDPDLLRIVALNLVGNAIKYGRDEGRVRVAAGTRPEAVWFTVWNEGPGFPASERSRLFRKFSRIPTPDLMRRKGTGIGLYTSWRIVQLHGGRIDAASEEGCWAEFRVELPLPPASS
jgi:signal transduction histidine kinase